MKTNKNMAKKSSFGTPRKIFTYLLTLSLRTTPVGCFPAFFVAFLKKAILHYISYKTSQIFAVLLFSKILKDSARSKGQMILVSFYFNVTLAY